MAKLDLDVIPKSALIEAQARLELNHQYAHLRETFVTQDASTGNFDLIFACKNGESIKAHRSVILASQSSLKNIVEEAGVDQKVVSINEAKEDFMMLVGYFYGAFPATDLDGYFFLTWLAVKYECIGLKEFAESILVTVNYSWTRAFSSFHTCFVRELELLKEPIFAAIFNQMKYNIKAPGILPILLRSRMKELCSYMKTTGKTDQEIFEFTFDVCHKLVVQNCSWEDEIFDRFIRFLKMFNGCYCIDKVDGALALQYMNRKGTIFAVVTLDPFYGKSPLWDAVVAEMKTYNPY